MSMHVSAGQILSNSQSSGGARVRKMCSRRSRRTWYWTGTNGKDGDSNQTTCLSNLTVKMMERHEVLRGQVTIVQNQLPVSKCQHAKCLSKTNSKLLFAVFFPTPVPVFLHHPIAVAVSFPEALL